MRHFPAIDTSQNGFHILGGSRRSQAATMVLAAGSSTGGPRNQHPNSEQWLYVLSGEGKAIVDGQEIALGAGSFLLIEAGENHEIQATRNGPLETINIYAPPVY